MFTKSLKISVVIGIFFLGFALRGQSQKEKIVEANQFILIDDNGKQRAKLFMYLGNPILNLMDKNETPRISLLVTSYFVSISIFDSHGNTDVSIESLIAHGNLDDKLSFLTIYNNFTKSELSFGIESKGELFMLRNEKGKPKSN